MTNENECNPADICAGCRCKYAAPSASAQQAEPVAWYDGNKFYASEMAAALDRSGPVRPVYYAAPAPTASPDTVGVILEMREQAREARQSDPDAGIFADHAYADLLDEWANRLERHDGRMSGLVRDYIEGMSVSIDVSTGEHDAGNRYYGFVSEVMDDPDDKHGVTLLVQDDVRPNFKVSASPANPNVAFCRVEDAIDNDSMLAQMGAARGDKLYTMDQMRSYADAFHRARTIAPPAALIYQEMDPSGTWESITKERYDDMITLGESRLVRVVASPADLNGENDAEQVRPEVDAMARQQSVQGGSADSGAGAVRDSVLVDDFRGDTSHLIRCIEALISMSDAGSLVPHGIGGHARALLSAAAVRLASSPADQVEDARLLDWLDEQNRKKNESHGTRYGWRYSVNHNRIALEDHYLPPITVREAIRAAMSASKEGA